MLFDAIQVNFINLSGLSRSPIAHTCNTMLELSSTYQSFPELREEFSAIVCHYMKNKAYFWLNSFYYCPQILKDRVLSLPYTVQ